MPEPIYQHGLGISQQIEMESLSKSVCPRRIEHKVPKYTFSSLFSQELAEVWSNIIYSDHVHLLQLTFMKPFGREIWCKAPAMRLVG